MPQRDITVEICVDDAAGLAAAVAGGADRIELCAALGLGGLTPSAGFMRRASNCGIPVYAMIRPRRGDFVFTAAEIDCMLYDIDAARSAGLAGVVLGMSRADGSLDTAGLERLCTHAAGLDLTLHRAFDVVPDFAAAVEAAVSLGFSRILTSGGERTAMDGLHALQRIVELAAGRISIMPGSGITAQNAPLLLERLAISELHASGSASVEESGVEKLATLGFTGRGGKRTQEQVVRALKQAVSA